MSLHADSISGSSPARRVRGLSELHRPPDRASSIPLRSHSRSSTSHSPFKSALMVTLIFTVVSVFFETLIGFGQALVLDQEFRRPALGPGRDHPPVGRAHRDPGDDLLPALPARASASSSTSHRTSVSSRRPRSRTASTRSSSSSSPTSGRRARSWRSSSSPASRASTAASTTSRRSPGASQWQQFKTITFPLVLPTVVIAMLFRTISAMRVYGIIKTMSG